MTYLYTEYTFTNDTLPLDFISILETQTDSSEPLNIPLPRAPYVEQPNLEFSNFSELFSKPLNDHVSTGSSVSESVCSSNVSDSFTFDFELEQNKLSQITPKVKKQTTKSLRERNREAARRSRQKKADTIQHLTAKCKELEILNARLQQQNMLLMEKLQSPK